MSVPWFERMNFSSRTRPAVPGLDHDRLRVDVHDRAGVPRDRDVARVSMAARYSSPVPIKGGSVIISGTACRCMFEPIRARLASLCSRNGISAVATETICAGLTSMYWTFLGIGLDGLAAGATAEDGGVDGNFPVTRPRTRSPARS